MYEGFVHSGSSTGTVGIASSVFEDFFGLRLLMSDCVEAFVDVQEDSTATVADCSLDRVIDAILVGDKSVGIQPKGEIQVGEDLLPFRVREQFVTSNVRRKRGRGLAHGLVSASNVWSVLCNLLTKG